MPTILSDIVEIRRAQLSQIENGAIAARIDTLYVIAQALEMTMEEMFRGF